MKLSPETLEILKNFSYINNAIIIPPGNVIRTINQERNVFAKATVSEEFPRDIPIYELNQFLKIFSLHKDADVNFSDEHYILVQQGPTRMKFYYADYFSLSKNLNIPSKDYTLDDIILSFRLESEQIERVKKAASMYSLSDLSVVGSDGIVELVVYSKSDPSSKSYNVKIAETEHNFSLNFVEKNMLMLSGSYDVNISRFSNSSFISNFINVDQNLEYVIALEPDSIFD
jgi:hypothetical protein